MEDNKNSDLVLAAVRISIAFESFGANVLLSALVIAFALASGVAQVLLGIFIIVVIGSFAQSKIHKKEKAHYGLYSSGEDPKQ